MLMLRLLYKVEVITTLCERRLPLALSSSSSGRERAVVIRIYPAATDRAYIITLVGIDSRVIPRNPIQSRRCNPVVSPNISSRYTHADQCNHWGNSLPNGFNTPSQRGVSRCYGDPLRYRNFRCLRTLEHLYELCCRLLCVPS